MVQNLAVIRARELRRNMSLPEGVLWQVLRTRPGGLKSRRQHPVGPYVVDFYCPAAKLVIEVDGVSHDMGARPARDARRTAWLKAQGLRVLRYTARDVLHDPGAVAAGIVARCLPSLPLHHASHGPPPHRSAMGRN
jgi:very-short-patch-repair endonuclease